MYRPVLLYGLMWIHESICKYRAMTLSYFFVRHFKYFFLMDDKWHVYIVSFTL